jgi:hypothetical protein
MIKEDNELRERIGKTRQEITRIEEDCEKEQHTTPVNADPTSPSTCTTDRFSKRGKEHRRKKYYMWYPFFWLLSLMYLSNIGIKRYGFSTCVRTIDDPSFLMNWTVPSFIIPVEAYSGSIFLHAIYLTISFTNHEIGDS